MCRTPVHEEAARSNRTASPFLSRNAEIGDVDKWSARSRGESKVDRSSFFFFSCAVFRWPAFNILASCFRGSGGVGLLRVRWLLVELCRALLLTETYVLLSVSPAFLVFLKIDAMCSPLRARWGNFPALRGNVGPG